MGQQNTWTPYLVDRLKSLADEGLSASQIAAELNVLGITRNAVIGKIKRLGDGVSLKGRAIGGYNKARNLRTLQIVKNQIGRAPDKPLPLPLPLPTSTTLPEKSAGLTMAQLSGTTCRWPMWVNRADERLYCGNPGARNWENHPYCPGHERMAWRKDRAT